MICVWRLEARAANPALRSSELLAIKMDPLQLVARSPCRSLRKSKGRARLVQRGLVLLDLRLHACEMGVAQSAWV